METPRYSKSQRVTHNDGYHLRLTHCPEFDVLLLLAQNITQTFSWFKSFSSFFSMPTWNKITGVKHV